LVRHVEGVGSTGKVLVRIFCTVAEPFALTGEHVTVVRETKRRRERCFDFDFLPGPVEVKTSHPIQAWFTVHHDAGIQQRLEFPAVRKINFLDYCVVMS
jgi:hypothetical protein